MLQPGVYQVQLTADEASAQGGAGSFSELQVMLNGVSQHTWVMPVQQVGVGLAYFGRTKIVQVSSPGTVLQFQVAFGVAAGFFSVNPGGVPQPSCRLAITRLQ
jgi:hypothetical protein